MTNFVKKKDGVPVILDKAHYIHRMKQSNYIISGLRKRKKVVKKGFKIKKI